MRRPLAILALLYAVGLVLAEYVPVPLALLWIATLALTAMSLLWARVRIWMLAAALVALGWLNLTWRATIVSPDDLRLLLPQAASVEVTLDGTLPETPSLRMFVRDEEESFRTLAKLAVEGLRTRDGWQSARGTVLVMTPAELPPDFHAGQRVRIEGILSPPRPALAPGLFDYRAYLRRQGIYFQLRAAGSNNWQVAASKPIPPPFADRFMAWAQGVLRRGLPEDESQRLLWAMTLGWKTALTNEVNEPFMRSGTMHIFAISGLHIALIAGILVSLLRVLQLSRAGCGAVVIPLIWFYTAATGWQPSAIRSTVMMTVIILGWALRRPSDLINSLAAAGFIILLWEPQQLFQASFQLSFFVVLSIALFLPPLEKLRDRLLQTDPLLPSELLPRWRRWLNGPLRWLTTAAATSIAAWLGSMPLTAYYFHLFSPVTLVANLVIVPLSSLALACNLGSLVCGAWWPAVTELFNWSAWFWMWVMIRASEIATQLPGAFFYVRSFTLVETLLWYGLLISTLSGWLFATKRRRWTLPMLGLVAIAYGWARVQQNQVVTLTAIPLSGGSAIYCDSPGGRRDLLIDCGTTNAVEFVTKPFLRAQGVNRLPRLLLTHGDLRCIGGAEDVLRKFRVQQVLASGVRQLSATYRRVMTNLNHAPARLLVVQRGDAAGLFTVLHPAEGDRFKQADDNAVVLRGEIHGTRVLLLSDLGRPGQETLMEREKDLWAELVIAGQPEQGEAVCDALLERMQPRVLVIVDSEYPAPERASPRLRARLVDWANRQHATVLYTRETGAVQLQFRRGSWTLQTMQGETMRRASQTNVGEASP